jgi:hypothetical protein
MTHTVCEERRRLAGVAPHSSGLMAGVLEDHIRFHVVDSAE